MKTFALRNGIEVLQPPSLNSPGAVARLDSLAPDLIVTAAYGKILPPSTLVIPTQGCVNIHPSLLPRHRGPSPVAATLLAGDSRTGVTIFQLDEGVDSGPIIAQEEHVILDEDNLATLTDRLFFEGGRLLTTILPGYLQGFVSASIQEPGTATYCTKLTKENGVMRWSLPARHLDREVRAYFGWPGSYTKWLGKKLTVIEARPIGQTASGLIGQVVLLSTGSDDSVGVVTGDGVLELRKIQMEGSRTTEAADFVRGHRDFVGAILPS